MLLERYNVIESWVSCFRSSISAVCVDQKTGFPGILPAQVWGHACDACALVDKSYPVKCHSKKQKCQSPECGSGRFCAGTYKGDAPPPGGTTEGVAQVETAIPALTDSDPDAGTPGKSPNNNIAAPGGSQQACSHCYAYCQTITILDTYDWDVDLGGGMSPSECVDAAEAKCGGAYNSLMTGAHCQN